MIDYKSLIHDNTQGGLDVFKYYISDFPTNMKKQFKLRDERSPSSSLHCKDGIWTVIDFGDTAKYPDGKAKNCIDFVMVEQGLDFKEACETIIKDLNIQTHQTTTKKPVSSPKSSESKPVVKKETPTLEIEKIFNADAAKDVPQKMLDALYEKRKISANTLDKFGVIYYEEYFWIKEVKKKIPALVFPIVYKGEFVNAKHRGSYQGQRKFSTVKDGKKVFYNINKLTKEHKTAILVEGEFDVFSIYEAYDLKPPYPVISVHSGVNSLSDDMDNCWEDIEHVETWIVFGDNDTNGIKMMDEFVRRIGSYKCKMVQHPTNCKDANDVLVNFGKAALKECVETAKPIPIEGHITVNSIMDDLLDMYRHGLASGDKAGYPYFDSLVSWVPKQTTVVTGIPNHGKTTFLNQLLVRLAARCNWKFGVFSPEYGEPKLNAKDLAEVIIGKKWPDGKDDTINPPINEEELIKCAKWTDKHFHFWLPPVDRKTGRVKRPTMELIFDSFEELIRRYGLKGVVIDPFNKVSRDKGEYMDMGWLNDFLIECTYFAKRMDIHLFIIAHPIKIMETKVTYEENGETIEVDWFKVPNQYNIAGGSEWYNQMFNILSVYKLPVSPTEYDTKVYVQKVKFKHIGSPGTATFKFDKATNRFFEKSQSLLKGFEFEWESQPEDNGPQDIDDLDDFTNLPNNDEPEDDIPF